MNRGAPTTISDSTEEKNVCLKNEKMRTFLFLKPTYNKYIYGRKRYKGRLELFTLFRKASENKLSLENKLLQTTMKLPV